MVIIKVVIQRLPEEILRFHGSDGLQRLGRYLRDNVGGAALRHWPGNRPHTSHLVEPDLGRGLTSRLGLMEQLHFCLK